MPGRRAATARRALERVLPGVERLPRNFWDQSLRELLTGPFGAHIPPEALELADRALREAM